MYEYKCINIYMNTSVWIYIYKYIRMNTYVWIYICMNIYVCIDIYVWIYAVLGKFSHISV